MSNKRLCTAKGTINRVKRQLIEWKIKFANHISDKRLISGIYKEHLQLNGKKLTPILKTGKRFEHFF